MSDFIRSGIKDKNGIEVNAGDKLGFPFINPLGGIDESGEADFTEVVEFKHGCFGYSTAVGFIPLMDWALKERGAYVPNMGNKTIITDDYIFWVIAE